MAIGLALYVCIGQCWMLIWHGWLRTQELLSGKRVLGFGEHFRGLFERLLCWPYFLMTRQL